jgi:cytolysin-activating lysine-acyltransferase
MMESPTHQHLFLADMKWLVLPPVMLRQFRLFRQNGHPFAYASWAMLTEEAEARVKTGQTRLRPDEWTGGDRLWLIDLIAPFGAQQEIIRDLKDKVFGGKAVKTLQPAPDGRGVGVVEW